MRCISCNIEMSAHYTKQCKRCLIIDELCADTNYKKERQMTEQNKILIDPSEYKDLKEGDEIEVVFTAKITNNACRSDNTGFSFTLVGLCFNNAGGGMNNFDRGIKSIHKILPKATPLEVGETVKWKSNNAKSKILHLSKKNHNITMVFLDHHNASYDETESFDKCRYTDPLLGIVRESGIPIDWEATFK